MAGSPKDVLAEVEKELEGKGRVVLRRIGYRAGRARHGRSASGGLGEKGAERIAAAIRQAVMLSDNKSGFNKP